MAWERRPRGTRYYTRSRKVDGRTVRQYVGSGLLGALAHEKDAARRAQAQEETGRWHAIRSQLEAADRATAEFIRAAERRVQVALVLAGYHQHHRGEWRKHRGRVSDKVG